MRLANLSRRVLLEQRKYQCFSCHHLLPLTLSVKQARDRGFQIPEKVLHAVQGHIEQLQFPDGHFFFPKHPSYGKITSTLVAGFAVSLLRTPGAQPKTKVAIKAIRFLADQQLTDGSIAPDFSFPPLLIGRGMATWMLIQLAGNLLPIAENDERTLLADVMQRARSWIEHATGLFEQNLFSCLSLPLAGNFLESNRIEKLQNLQAFRSTLSFSRDPELRSLLDRLIFDLGAPVTKKNVPPPAHISRSLAAELWQLHSAIVQEPPAEEVRQECRW